MQLTEVRGSVRVSAEHLQAFTDAMYAGQPLVIELAGTRFEARITRTQSTWPNIRDAIAGGPHAEVTFEATLVDQ